MTIFDISPPVSERLAVWPGDTPYSRQVLMDTDQGDHLGLSKITTTLHLGAHTDAPNHYAPGGQGMSARSLHYYLGPCQVVTASTPKGQRIQWNELSHQQFLAPRVLVKTNSFPDPENWNEDFCAFSPEVIQKMADQHVILVGIDTPSVDLFSCKELLSHQVVHKNNMAILEGITLKDINEGLYELSALPLNLENADASPVRAILIQRNQ